MKKIKKIMFLNPPFSPKQLYGDLSVGGSELPPLGIALLAAIIRENGYSTTILDAAALKLDYNQTVKIITDESPDVLGITSTTITIFNAAAIAKMLKETGCNTKIIIGGAHVTACPHETMNRFPYIDFGVIGEGEITLLELLNCLNPNFALEHDITSRDNVLKDADKSAEKSWDSPNFPSENLGQSRFFCKSCNSNAKFGLNNNYDLKNCKGIVYRNDGIVVFTDKRPFIENLDTLPFPAWDLLPNLVKYYQPAADSLHRSPATLLIATRGCPGQCIFCDKSIFGNKLRSYSAGYIVSMIEHLQNNYGIKDIFFEDDNFLAFRKVITEFCRLLKEKKIDITFSVMGRVDLVNHEILKMLKDAGCWQINYGCESGSQKILDILNKGITLEQTENALKITRGAGLKIKGLFMLGSFGETENTINETFRFIKKYQWTISI